MSATVNAKTKPITRVKKPWGYEEIVERNKDYVVKKLFMKKGHQCSRQYHEKKRETILGLEGTLTIELQGEDIQLRPFETRTIHPLEVHRMKAVDGDCLYLECSTSELEDVVRIEDAYGRA